jgi:hypothetical protein
MDLKTLETAKVIDNRIAKLTVLQKSFRDDIDAVKIVAKRDVVDEYILALYCRGDNVIDRALNEAISLNDVLEFLENIYNKLGLEKTECERQLSLL